MDQWKSQKASWEHWADEIAKVYRSADALGGAHDNTPGDQEAARLLELVCDALFDLEIHARKCALASAEPPAENAKDVP